MEIHLSYKEVGNFNLNEKRQSTAANSEMMQMLVLSGKNFEVANKKNASMNNDKYDQNNWKKGESCRKIKSHQRSIRYKKRK